MSRDDIRPVLGAPASQFVFYSLGEDIWECRAEGIPRTEETYVMVHFDVQTGVVRKTSRRIAIKG